MPANVKFWWHQGFVAGSGERAVLPEPPLGFVSTTLDALAHKNFAIPAVAELVALNADKPVYYRVMQGTADHVNAANCPAIRTPGTVRQLIDVSRGSFLSLLSTE